VVELVTDMYASLANELDLSHNAHCEPGSDKCVLRDFSGLKSNCNKLPTKAIASGAWNSHQTKKCKTNTLLSFI